MIAYRESAAAPFLTTSITEFDRIRNMAYLTIKVRTGILKITKGAAGRRSAPKENGRNNRIHLEMVAVISSLVLKYAQ